MATTIYIKRGIKKAINPKELIAKDLNTVKIIEKLKNHFVKLLLKQPVSLEANRSNLQNIEVSMELYVSKSAKLQSENFNKIEYLKPPYNNKFFSKHFYKPTQKSSIYNTIQRDDICQ